MQDVVKLRGTPWNLDAQGSLTRLTADLQDTLRQWFPQGEQRPQQPYITDETRELLDTRRAARRVCNAERRWRMKLPAREAWIAWRNCTRGAPYTA